MKNYECGDCGYSCYLKTDLERHILNVHDKVKGALSQLPIDRNFGCQYLTFRREFVAEAGELSELFCGFIEKLYTGQFSLSTFTHVFAETFAT